MKRFWQDKGRAGNGPDVERLIASARPEPSSLSDDSAERIFRQAMAEAYREEVPPVRLSPRRAWGFAGAGALATLLIAVGGALWLDGAPEKLPNNPPVETTQKPAVVIAPEPNAGRRQPGAAATPRVDRPRRNIYTARVDGRATERRGSGRQNRLGGKDRTGARMAKKHAIAPRERPTTGLVEPGTDVVAEDHLARLLVMVDPGSAALDVEVDRRDESVPGYAHVAAYTPDENGGTVTEATLTASGGTETALYREGWFDTDGDGGTLRVEVTVTAGEPTMAEAPPAAEAPAAEAPAAEPASPEADPMGATVNMKDIPDKGVE